MDRKTIVLKFVVKGVLAFGVSAAIGFAIKAQKNIENQIDEYYAPESEETPEVTES